MKSDHETPNALIKRIDGVGLRWEFEDQHRTHLAGKKMTADGPLIVKIDHSTGYWTDRALVRKPEIKVWAYIERQPGEHVSLFFHTYGFDEKKRMSGGDQQGYTD